MARVAKCAPETRAEQGKVATTTKPNADLPRDAIAWYRTPLDRATLRELNTRSDFLGFLQTGGYLGLLALTGTTIVLGMGHIPWPLIVLTLFFHGMCWHFMINGFHELAHNSVFKTRWLNSFFLRILSFLGWHNHVQFWASHTEHHKYTLHPPDDLEVVLPSKITLSQILKTGIINHKGIVDSIKYHYRLSRLRLVGEWENALFPESKPRERRKLATWSTFVLIGHATILVVSLALQLWMVPVVVSLAPFYGSLLFQLCNNTQHIGLSDNVPDFRLCSRTIILNPFVRFLYWHMNYHTEHHMYAAVPCYKLGKLHKLIKHDLPHCPHGIFETWREIFAIQKRQEIDPDYEFKPDLPATA